MIETGNTTSKLEVHVGAFNIVPVGLGFDVSADEFLSEIREGPTVESPIILSWDIQFATDGTDGELILSVEEEESDTDEKNGYMDMIRISGGKPIRVFAKPIKVVFIKGVTEWVP